MSSARQNVLDTAAALFAERGYELVGINEIIAKSGVAKATFYSHFSSKEKLCADWLRDAAARSRARYRSELAEPGHAAEKILARFEGLNDYLNSCDFRGCPFSITASMIAAGSEVRDVIREYKENARTFWQALAMELRKDPAEGRLLGDTLFLLYSGAVTEAQNCRDHWPVKSAKQIAAQLCEELTPA